MLSCIVSWPFKEWTGLSHHWLLIIVPHFSPRQPPSQHLRSMLSGPRSLLRESQSPFAKALKPSSALLSFSLNALFPATHRQPQTAASASQPISESSNLLLRKLQFSPSHLCLSGLFPSLYLLSSQTTGHRFDLPALLSPLLLQLPLSSQSTCFQPPNNILFCSS